MDTVSLALFGVEFDSLDGDAARDFVLAHDHSQQFAYVVTPNVDHLARLRAEPGLRVLYRDAALRLLDSRLLAHLLRLRGMAPPPVATGADLVAAVLPALDARTARVAVIGLDAVAMAALRRRYPAIGFLHHSPVPGFEADPALLVAARDFAIAAAADCTLLAVGSPRQEILAHAIWRTGRARGIGLCVGAAPLFAAGVQRRAPRALRAAGLEWAWRLAREPRRLGRRYLVDGPPALLAALREATR